MWVAPVGWEVRAWALKRWDGLGIMTADGLSSQPGRSGISGLVDLLLRQLAKCVYGRGRWLPEVWMWDATMVCGC